MFNALGVLTIRSLKAVLYRYFLLFVWWTGGGRGRKEGYCVVRGGWFMCEGGYIVYIWSWVD